MNPINGLNENGLKLIHLYNIFIQTYEVNKSKEFSLNEVTIFFIILFSALSFIFKCPKLKIKIEYKTIKGD